MPVCGWCMELSRYNIDDDLQWRQSPPVVMSKTALLHDLIASKVLYKLLQIAIPLFAHLFRELCCWWIFPHCQGCSEGGGCSYATVYSVFINRWNLQRQQLSVYYWRDVAGMQDTSTVVTLLLTPTVRSTRLRCKLVRDASSLWSSLTDFCCTAACVCDVLWCLEPVGISPLSLLQYLDTGAPGTTSSPCHPHLPKVSWRIWLGDITPSQYTNYRQEH